MVSASAHTSGQGVHNAFRVTVKKVEEGSLVDWTFFVRRVLLQSCGSQAAGIFCLQDFPSRVYFDVTFRSMKQCEDLLKVFEEKGAAALTSLGRCVQPEGGSTSTVDPSGSGTACGRIRADVAVNCKVTLCSNCKQEDHLAKDYKESKSCELCGEAGHLYKACQRRGGTTYPQMAKSGNAGRGPTKIIKKVRERWVKPSKLQKTMQNLFLLQTMGASVMEDLQELKSQQASLFASEASKILFQSRFRTVCSCFFFQK
eukprot:g33654.t1